MARRVFGLTGGIGSGKSAVGRRLRARGLPVVDADQLAREAVAPGGLGLRQIVERFGSGVLSDSGELNRAQFGQVVFADRAARHVLDAIVHPIVRQLAEQRFREIAAQGEPLACYEVPLLYEIGLEHSYHPVVVVTSPLALRNQRLLARDGLSEPQIEARIASQMPLEQKEQRADYVIDNGGTLTELEQRTDAVFERLCRDLGVAATRYPLPALS